MTQQQTDSNPALSVLRGHRRRRGSTPDHELGGRLFGRPFSYDLAERAPKAGVTQATVTLGRTGFVPGAKGLVADVSEVPPTTLPPWVELVAPVDGLEAFVGANRDELADDAVLLRLGAARTTLPGASA